MVLTLRFCILILAAGVMAAAEYGGVVRASGLPLPGAVVTASRGEQKLSTTTDENGAFSFAELADGEWTVEVQSLGFTPLRRSVTIGAGSPRTPWDLTFIPKDALLAAVAPGAAPQPRRRTTATGAAAQRPGFERVDVNQAADAQAFATEGNLRAEETADLGQSAANSFLVQGSVSSAAGLPQQNDWAAFGPPMGMGMGPAMPGMTGMPGGPGGLGPNDDGPPQGPNMRGGPGSFGGRGPGGPSGPGGGFGGPGSRGPGGPGRPGMG